jgi:hypothetical protein
VFVGRFNQSFEADEGMWIADCRSWFVCSLSLLLGIASSEWYKAVEAGAFLIDRLTLLSTPRCHEVTMKLHAC